MLLDLAEYLSLEGRTEAALEISAHGCRVAERCENLVEARLRRLDRARLLLGAGRAGEALALLPEDQETSSRQRVTEALIRAEALFRVGSVSEAQDWLYQDYNMAWNYGLDTRETDILARQF